MRNKILPAWIITIILFSCHPGAPDIKNAGLWETVEYSLENPGWAGNPFDLEAQVVFHHSSGETIRTGMFYAGENTWKFRFTGILEGEWTFITESDAPRLSGKRGSILVRENNGQARNGFITAAGNKWKWSGTGKVFVPQLAMYKAVEKYHGKPDVIRRDIDEFIEGHGFNGFHVPMDCRWYGIDKPKAAGHTDEPLIDLKTFDALDSLISLTSEAGGMVHLWMWGKPAAGTSNLRWGVNSETDKRLQRYIAARLGPLPGWTLGYGWDLNMWYAEGPFGGIDLNDGKALGEWHDYLRENMGWKHMIGARWISLEEPRPRKIMGHFNEKMDFMAYQRHRVSYDEYVDAMNHMPDYPSFESDRFRIRHSPKQFRAKDYDEGMTRRGLWHSTMAGGVANIWGNLAMDDGKNNPSDAGTLPYAIRDQIKTYSVFFFEKNRFRRDMFPNPTLTKYLPGIRIEGDNGALHTCLASSDNEHFIFYCENTDRVYMYLYGMQGKRPFIAVDTRKEYLEILGGMLEPGIHTWKAPYESDWAVAVGNFE